MFSAARPFIWILLAGYWQNGWQSLNSVCIHTHTAIFQMNAAGQNLINLPAATMERLLKIDAFRGLLLLIMATNHTPSPLRTVTTQPLGFVSAAEAFVFVSAFLCGMIFSRKLQNSGPAEMKRLARSRIRQIYRAHLLTLLFCFAVIGHLLSHQLPFYYMIHLYLEQSVSAVFSALLLLYQPPLLDILPMYLVFIALTPWIMRTLVRTGEGLVLAVSLLLWLAAQYGLKEWITSAFTGGWLVIDPGAFNLFAWQLLWVSGLLLGRRFQQDPESPPLALPKVLWPVLAGFAIFFFCCRWPWIPISLELSGHDWLLDKWRLGPLRLLNFLALLSLAFWLAPALARILDWLKPLAPVGRHLLPLFCLHVCFSLLATGFIEAYELPDAWCYAILTLHLTVLFCASLLLDRFSSNQISNTPATPALSN